MKLIVIIMIFIGTLYPQCGSYTSSECSSNLNCEWIDDIETGNCGNLVGEDCELNPECNWNCDFVDDYMGWCTYSCDGGPYEIDNSYCQEIEMPECSDMNEIQCNGEDGCSWYEDIDSVSCGSLSASECSQYFDDGCSLDADCIQWGSWYTWICYEYGPQYCTGGDIDIDNSSVKKFNIN